MPAYNPLEVEKALTKMETYARFARQDNSRPVPDSIRKEMVAAHCERIAGEMDTVVSYIG